ncbi:MAG: type I-E CRISPR-associated protein Cse1/CasA [Methanoregula sp.]
MYNLLHEQWIPVKRKVAEKPEYISPSQITDGLTTNPIIALAAPRPDFNGALIQFLIGLVQTAYPPMDESEWRKKFRSPPSSEKLKAAFERYANAFNLVGYGPRFMQDLDLPKKGSEQNKIDHILIEMPGDQTLDKNTDQFLKRNTVRNICLSCCAMALFTLQTNAPAGGRGHRTSLRGGGPLTTLVIGKTLWETIWLNVITRDSFSHFGNVKKTDGADMFPWLGHTRTSTKNKITTSRQVHPIQMFWGMPRRIRIIFEETHTDAIQCDLCGCSVHDYTSRYFHKSYGINYKNGWHHILSPYSIDLKTGKSLPILGHRGVSSYRNWLGLIQNSSEKNFKREPAVVVHVFRKERESDLSEMTASPFRLWAFGYDMDNMKARGWYEGTMPLVHVDKEIRSEYEIRVGQMIKTANLIAFNVLLSIKKALFAQGAEISADLSIIDSEFWQNTEPDFYRILDELCTDLENRQSLNNLKLHWLSTLSREGEILFDRYSQSNLISVADPKRIALARRDFKKFSSPYNKKIIELLDLQKPEESAKTRDKERKISEQLVS